MSSTKNSAMDSRRSRRTAPAGAQVREHVGEALVRGVGRMFRTIGLQIGYRYEDSPICVPDGTPSYPDDPEDFIPSARPGSRAPHVWLGDGRSILDLFGRGFVLLRLGADAPDVSAFEAAAAERHVPLKTVTVTEPRRRSSTSAGWCWCGRTDTWRGGPTTCRRMPPRSSTKCAAQQSACARDGRLVWNYFKADARQGCRKSTGA